jgi:hypothetical protein
MKLEEIKQLSEDSWEGCQGCNETDKYMYMNGFQRGYIHAKTDLYTLEDMRAAFQAGMRYGKGENKEHRTSDWETFIELWNKIKTI